MTVNKRKKVSRQRGSHTHGWGSKKKHRGAGNRGGRGMAGSGKRADQLKPTILKLYGNAYYGKHGFYRHGLKRKVKAVNIGWVESYLDELVKDKKIVKEGEFYIIDLKKLMYDKILGTGGVQHKFKVLNGIVTKRAAEKIKSAGGEVTGEPVK